MDNFERYIKHYKPLIYYIAKKYHVHYFMEYDDILQEGYLALWDTILNYDKSKASFDSFLTIKLENHFINLWKKNNRIKNRYTNLSIDKEYITTRDGSYTLLDVITTGTNEYEKIYLHDYIQKFLNIKDITELEKEVLKYTIYYRLQGHKNVAKK